ncbi:MAG: hypothetical protein ACRCZN_08415 [Lactococcus lactis]
MDEKIGTIKVYCDEKLYLTKTIDFKNRRVISSEYFKEDTLMDETLFNDKISRIIYFIIRNFSPRQRVIDEAKKRLIRDATANYKISIEIEHGEKFFKIP